MTRNTPPRLARKLSRSEITLADVRELLAYNPSDGSFTWLKSSGRAFAGQTVQQTKDGRGYVKIGLYGQRYLAHRLAWILSYGEWPKHEVDHKNRDRTDNRLCNLRAATDLQNAANTSLRTSNTSGVRNVSWNRKLQKWLVQATVGGRRKHIGVFASKAEASAVSAAFSCLISGEFSPQHQDVLFSADAIERLLDRSGTIDPELTICAREAANTMRLIAFGGRSP